MRYISIITKHGFKYFINASVKECRKKIFVNIVKAIYKGKEKISYSQYAEDLFIDFLLGYKESGTYIDVGANHPDILSNTKKFYERGWRGVNIDPDSKVISLFLKDRPEDINLNVGLGEKRDNIVFYNFEKNTLSTFSEDVALKLQKEGTKLLGIQKIDILTLNEIFSMLKTISVDFVSIDTEGYDENVLKGNDWNLNRPKVVCIEDETGHKYDYFFKKNNYRKVCFNGLNSIFVDKK